MNGDYGTNVVSPAFDEAHNATHNGPASRPMSPVLRALELVHNPRSPNEHRQQASEYLEQVKAQEDAPLNGYQYAFNKAHRPLVRHFGLSMLENAIRLHWIDYTGEQSLAVREWTLKLAESVDRGDPLFIRNKIAQLWVEVAKRSWALDWMNMDELLVGLWGGSAVQKVLVLEVLETLSENSFGKEDTITALRGNDLSKACVEIFTPARVMAEHFPKRDMNINLRYGEEGWLLRVSELLDWCNNQGGSDPDVRTCTLKALAMLKSIVPWIILAALAEVRTVDRICRSLMTTDCAIQLVSFAILC